MPNASAPLQPDLWTQPRPRRRHRTASTSLNAHDAMRDEDRLAPQERIVLNAVRAYGPLTRHQVAAITHLPLASVCGRVKTLLEKEELVEPRGADGRRERRNGRHVVQATFQTQRAG